MTRSGGDCAAAAVGSSNHTKANKNVRIDRPGETANWTNFVSLLAVGSAAAMESIDEGVEQEGPADGDHGRGTTIRHGAGPGPASESQRRRPANCARAHWAVTYPDGHSPGRRAVQGDAAPAEGRCCFHQLRDHRSRAGCQSCRA